MVLIEKAGPHYPLMPGHRDIGIRIGIGIGIGNGRIWIKNHGNS